MKILLWILIIGIPACLLLQGLAMLAYIQHWPVGGILRFTGPALLLLLVLAWIFAIRSRKKIEGASFESL